MKSKKIKYLLIVFLTLLEMSSLFLAWKSLSHKITIIDDVKFKEENKKEKKAVAIMLNDGNGSYKESESTTFPKVGYIYNTQKSGCIDTTGKEVVNAINYESGKVSLRLNQKLYCYLYFDKKEKPIIDKFYINDETSNKVTKVPEVTLHLKWSDQYIKEYCISETQDIDSCSWQSTNGGTEITSNYTFTSEGKKTIYAYIKDIAEGVSEVKSDSIEYKAQINGGDIVTNLPEETADGGGALTEVIKDELKMKYYGKNPPNYICFGTTSKTECTSTSGQDKYMYRIIGVDRKNRFKVIKKEALNKAYSWNNVYNQDIKWPQSDLFKGLNGSYFLTDRTYLPSGWSSKIETMDWKYGDIYNLSDWYVEINISAAEMVQKEQGWTTIVSAKIGLMYLADYYYGVTKTGLNCQQNGFTCRVDNWMHFLNNDSNAPNKSYEWSMSRYGKNSENNYANFAVHSGGIITWLLISVNSSVRPVFYLIPSIEISGSGTITDPYIIVN